MHSDKLIKVIYILLRSINLAARTANHTRWGHGSNNMQAKSSGIFVRDKDDMAL
jgi:hypothetical protein